MGKARMTDMRFTSFPRTMPPPEFILSIIDVFRRKEKQISTIKLAKGKTSDEVLNTLRGELVKIGFRVERGKTKDGRIERPVFYGENGVPQLQYQVDAYHDEWRCGLEIEAGRAWMGNAVYRDMIQAMVMVQVDHLCIAIPNVYKFKSGNNTIKSPDYDNTIAVATALFGHSRLRVPYGLTIIGY